MAANLTLQYQKAEEAYRRAQTAQERLRCLEQMLQQIPKHKGTEKLQADLKTRLKEARDDLLSEASSPRKGKSYRIARQGAGTVIVLGGPNSGKSRVVAELTNAQPEVAPYPYTTREPLPAIMSWEGITIQLVDTPPIAVGHLEPYLVSFARTADLVLLCMDGSSDDAPQQTADVFELLQHRKTVLSNRTGLDEQDLSVVHVRTLLVVTRGGEEGADVRREMLSELVDVPGVELFVDLDRSRDVQRLGQVVFDGLQVLRIYTKRPGEPVNKVDPFTVPIGSTVQELAEQVHAELAARLKSARIWSDSGKSGESVGREYVLADGDVVELHT